MHAIHEAATKYDDLIAKRYTGMPVTTLDALGFNGAEIQVLPVGPVLTGGQPSHLAVALVILAAN